MTKLDALLERARLLPEPEQEELARVIEDFLDSPIEIPAAGPGSDAELAERIADWEANPVGVPAEEVFAWLTSIKTNAEQPPPKPRRLR